MFQISNLSCWGPSGLSKSKKFSLTNFPMFMDFLGTGLSQHTVQGNFELYSISLNFIYKIMVQMSFYCVYILPQSYARVQFPKFLRFLWEIKAASAKKVRKTGQPFSQQPVHQHFLVLKEHQNV